MTGSLGKMPWRMLGWGTAILLLAAPFVAMRFTSEVNWSLGDFIFAGVLFSLIGGALELAVRASSNHSYRIAAGLALLGALLVVWVDLAVGIVGSERNPANLLFFGALLVGIAGSLMARFRAAGMALAMLATAVTLWLAFVAAVFTPTDEPFVSHGVEFAGTSLLALIFLGSAAMFRKAARQ